MSNQQPSSSAKAVENYFRFLLDDVAQAKTKKNSLDAALTQGNDASFDLQQWHNIAVSSEVALLNVDIFSLHYGFPAWLVGDTFAINKPAPLLDLPNWYMGSQYEQGKQWHILDMARWAMPDKLENDQHQKNYQYFVSLPQSHWAIACNFVYDIRSVHKDQIHWRSRAGKRPWLAGINQQTVIIHLPALLAQLNSYIKQEEE